MPDVCLVVCRILVFGGNVRDEILLEQNGKPVLEVFGMKVCARDQSRERKSAVNEKCREDVLVESALGQPLVEEDRSLYRC